MGKVSNINQGKKIKVEVEIILNPMFKKGLDKIGFCEKVKGPELIEYADFFNRVEKTWLIWNQKRNQVIDKYVEKIDQNGLKGWKKRPDGILDFGNRENLFNKEMDKLVKEIATIDGEKLSYCQDNIAGLSPVEYYFMKSIIDVTPFN